MKLAAKGSASFPRLDEFTRSNEGEEGEEESMHELGEEGGEDKLDARAGLCARYMEKEKKNIPDVFVINGHGLTCVARVFLFRWISGKAQLKIVCNTKLR